jgi:hypothetical protein
MNKWPYTTSEWKDWLKLKNRGLSPPLPNSSEWLLWLDAYKTNKEMKNVVPARTSDPLLDTEVAILELLAEEHKIGVEADWPAFSSAQKKVLSLIQNEKDISPLGVALGSLSWRYIDVGIKLRDLLRDGSAESSTIDPN